MLLDHTNTTNSDLTPYAMEPSVTTADTRERLRAGLISLVVGGCLLAAKYVAYRLTGSAAILSDALESIVNVAAALFSLGAVVFAGHPADRNHPYGHGKIEFFSAVFEGGLITFAAILVLYASAASFLSGAHPQALDLGIAITLLAGAANALLGWYLIRTGRRCHSPALTADGHHVLTDFWTSLGVVVGLGLVAVTGVAWLDPLIATVVGLNLAWVGVGLVRHAAGGLLDEEDTSLLGKLVEAFNASREPGIVRVHFLRAIRFGRFTHVDAHLVVPEFWTVERAHESADRFERRVIESLPFEGEIAFHTDPCRRLYCRTCEVENCTVRLHTFAGFSPMTVEETVQTDRSVLAQLSAHDKEAGT